jgi:beta-lactamase class A
MNDDRSTSSLRDRLNNLHGSEAVGVWLGDLDGRVRFSHHPDATHRAASTMKLPLAVAALQLAETAALDLSQLVLVHNRFPSAAPGHHFGVALEDEDFTATVDQLGRQVTVEWLLGQMITTSSNLATNLLLELTGVGAADDVLRKFGTAGVIRRGLYDEPAMNLGLHNLMTAADLAAVLIGLKTGRAAGPESSQLLLDLLAANVWTEEIPAGLPPGIRVEHKNGWLTGVRHDGGIVYPDDADPFVLVVLTSGLADAEAGQLIADIATHAWQTRQADPALWFRIRP